MNVTLQTAKYILADLLSAAIAWFAFFSYRKLILEPKVYGYEVEYTLDPQFYKGILLIPIYWFILYAISGTYRGVYRKSRFKELGQTITVCSIGLIILFFAVLLDDIVVSHKSYYQSVTVLFGLHFGMTFLFRFTLTSITNIRIHNRKLGFNTVIIGKGPKAYGIYEQLESEEKSAGNKFVGYVTTNGKDENNLLDEHLKHLGTVKNISAILEDYQIEEVIIAIESDESDETRKIMNELASHNVILKIIPDMYDILKGSVKMSSIYDAALIEIFPEIMPSWQKSLKRVMDIVVSLLVLGIGFPIFAFTAIMVKLTSKGPIFYSHERIGQYGMPFTIFKFRSMFVNSEKSKPQLSSKDDKRITSFGKFMRKTRLDEIPQFYNVLIGDMCLVGPRPEREFFIEQIVEVAPHYRHLHKVKPGITSWGQVKFGYAENVEEMVKRLKYDIIYIENMSLALDFKILIYTVMTVLKGTGK